jgi:hypothetical protein
VTMSSICVSSRSVLPSPYIVKVVVRVAQELPSHLRGRVGRDRVPYVCFLGERDGERIVVDGRGRREHEAGAARTCLARSRYRTVPDRPRTASRLPRRPDGRWTRFRRRPVPSPSSRPETRKLL